MCGLAGMIGPGVSHDHLKAFKTLLYITALRGDDSTGIFTVQTSKDIIKIDKTVQDAAAYLWSEESKKYEDKMLGSIMPDVFVGHCRAATVGKVTVENAHPFDTGRYVSCHNGTLTDYEYLDRDKTDSQMMFEAVETKGLARVLADLDVWSAYAVVSYDKEEKVVRIARNSQRTLWVGICKKDSVLFYSSESSMLKFISDRNKIEMDIYYFEPDKIYTIDPQAVKADYATPWTVEDLPEPETKVYSVGGGRKKTKGKPRGGATASALADFYDRYPDFAYSDYVDESFGYLDADTFTPTKAKIYDCCSCGQECTEEELDDKIEFAGDTYAVCVDCSKNIEIDHDEGRIKARGNKETKDAA